MKIKRIFKGKEVEIELTSEELAQAKSEFTTAFMEDILVSDFGISDEKAGELAIKSYEKYCEGNGLTEYECVEETVHDWQTSVKRIAYDINWDVENEDMSEEEMASLPSEIEIPEGIICEQEISDYVSDFSGFCHNGFKIREQ